MTPTTPSTNGSRRSARNTNNNNTNNNNNNNSNAANPSPRTPMTPSSSPPSSSGARSTPAARGTPPSSTGFVPPTPVTPSSANEFRRRPELGGAAYRFTTPSSRNQVTTPVSPGGDASLSNSQSSGVHYSQESSGSVSGEMRQEIWGTTVNVQQAERAFRQFINTFKEHDDQQGAPFYMQLLHQLIDSNADNMNLNCHNLFRSQPSLYHQLLLYPQELIPAFDSVLSDERSRLRPDMDFDALGLPPLQSRPFNLLQTHNMRALNPEQMDTLVAIRGMVIRVGSIVPEMHRAFFRCSACAFEVLVTVENGTIVEPIQCQHCQSRQSFQLDHNRCFFQNKQVLRIQEIPDEIPEGETPHSIKVLAYEALVDVAKPGDRVEITGIYKAVPVKTNPRRSTLSTTYRTYLDAIHFKKNDAKRLQVEFHEKLPEDDEEAINLTKSESYTSFEESDMTEAKLKQLEDKILELGAQPDIYHQLVNSLAPSIWELDDLKKGLLCLLFGGSGSEEGARSGKFRGEINVLMCGDPGTSKSQLLQYVHKIAPRGIYTSGKGSSAVGLTASVVKDAESREMVLESGALVLSDRGVCCIDEFDKMSDATRSILHEVMEQQTVSIAKAGIVCTLNARTSILASANPKESRYNPKLSVVENIQIMPTLLSRFDLIYLILDQPNEKKDRKLAKHLVGLYYQDVKRSAQATIPMDLLTAYISYARRHIRPVLCDEAEERLIEHYTNMRQQGVNQKTITATPRQLEALIRLSEALAKMELKQIVEVKHVDEAKKLMDLATQRAATDPTTGRIDMDLLQTGHSAAQRRQVDQLTQDAKTLLVDQYAKRSVRFDVLLKELKERAQIDGSADAWSDQHLRDVLAILETDGVVRVGKVGKSGDRIQVL